MKLDGVQQTDQVEKVKTAQEASRQFLGTMRLHRGHQLFKRLPSGVVVPLTDDDYIEGELQLRKDGTTRKARRVLTQDGCLYVGALNIKNATRKFTKMGLLSI